MKRSVYGRTDTTKKAINQAKKELKRMKEENPEMTWQERNVIMNKIGEQYKDNEMYQPIFYGDSVCNWWRKNYGGR